MLLLLAACEAQAPAPRSAPARRPHGNGTPLGELATVALSTMSLADHAELGERLAATMSAGLFQYMVECALAEDQQLTVDWAGEPLEIQGAAGYAPQWADGPCDVECQEWVTACLLARGNAYPVHARLWFHTRDHPLGIDDDDPRPAGYTVQEGAFYGNWFEDPPRLHACRGRGRDPFYDVIRVCTHPGSACGIQAIGPCLDEDAAVPHACEELEGGLGFRRCHDRLARDGVFPEGSRTFDRVVTSWLPGTMFAGETNTCGSVDPGDFPVRAPALRAAEIGDACATNDDCGSPELLCALRTGAGWCTRGCEADDDCGQGSICQPLGDDGTVCARTCRARIDGGEGCREGQVCTGYQLFDAETEPTCSSFCTDDEDCRGSFCNERTGGCEIDRPEDPRALPDGQPCRDDVPCRGFCLPFTGPDGLCASWVPWESDDTRCPDPDVEPIVANTYEDDLALCAFLSCARDSDCPDRLVCSDLGCTFP